MVALLLSAPLFAAQPYHLELELTPEAAFPYLGRFGKVDLHVYQGGVRGEALWLHGMSRNGAPSVIVANPLARMYVDVELAEITGTLARMAGSQRMTGTAAALGPTLKGTVGGIAATRYRINFGPAAYVDLWTTDVVPANAQYRAIIHRVVDGIAPGVAAITSRIPGNPVYVELNFRRYKKTPIVKLKKLTMAAEDEEDALTLGSFYVRAGVFEKILTR